MVKVITSLLFALRCSIMPSLSQDLEPPDTVSATYGKLELKGLLWRPSGKGLFPTIIFCHGSYETNDTRYDPVQQTSILGPLFAKHGYIFFDLFRRGVGLSKEQGENSADMMATAFRERGQEERNKIQMVQLETDQLQDMITGNAFLRRRTDVDTNRIAVIGHSFGGSLALLFAEHDPRCKAVVIFGAAGYSWDRSPELRTRLSNAVKNITAPVMMIHAQNDYSVNPGFTLDSLMRQNNKPHILKIYPAFGNTQTEGHNIIFLSTKTWEADVFKFLRKNLWR